MITWPLVAIIAMVLGFDAAILVLVPETNGLARSIILVTNGGLTAIFAGIYVKQGVERKVDEKVEELREDVKQDRREDADAE